MKNHKAEVRPDQKDLPQYPAWFLYGASCEERFAFAQLLHGYDGNGQGPFIIAQPAGVPRVLQEEAFFGPQEEAWVNQARGGMLVINEIDSLVPSVQQKFASLLQNGCSPFCPDWQAEERPDIRLVMTSAHDKALLLEHHALEASLHAWLMTLDSRHCVDSDRIRAAQCLPSGRLSGFSILIEPLLREHVKGWLEAGIDGLHAHILAEIERPLIITTLNYTRGNQIRAAALLGLNRNTLRKKIRDLHITVLRGSAKDEAQL